MRSNARENTRKGRRAGKTKKEVSSRFIFMFALSEFRPKTSNVNFQRVTKLSLNLPFTIHYNCTEINTFTPVLSIRIVLSCFICSFSNLNISHLYVCRKRDSKSLCSLSNYFSLKIDIKSGGRSVENSPFPLNVVQPNNPVVRLRQPEEADSEYLVRRELDIALDATEGTQNMSSYVEGPDNENVPSSFDKGDDGLYHVKFVPYQPGTYKVRAQFSR